MKITIIGAGAMGGAIAKGLLYTQSIAPQDLTLTAAHQETLTPFAEQGVRVTLDNVEAVKEADLVILVVKPWLVYEVLQEIGTHLNSENQQLVVVAAGVKGEELQAALTHNNRCVALHIVVPNIAIAVAQSMTFVTPVVGSRQNTETVVSLFGKLGEVIEIPEKSIDAATTLASCGIAYAMRYIRAASEGGVELGFKAKQAQKIVQQTVLGAVRLLQETGQHPEEAIDNVTTPGGLTIKGLNEMEHGGFTSAVINGLKAAIKKG